ncbi:DNA polymerase III subunit gamma/tau [Candidatus Saccharibacteria bacterium]|nr:DNA polymerase III subunit gamma/tau [Candidatus Saccharibacteria bacterium]
MGKALYRKYRPKTLAEVVGEEQVTKILENAIKEQKISHAYLFIGPRGCGKTSVARIFAHAINDFKYELEDDYVDIIEIDAASNTGVDNIRELREKACIAPSKGKYKVYIIDEVHMLSKSAFNALLKTLEEPPKHVIFIMATTDAYKVPVTITSRAQTFTFKLADSKTMFDFLKEVCTKEKIKIDDDALKIVVSRGGGSFRDSLSLLDQVSTLSKDGISKELLINALGLPEDEKLSLALESYAAGDLAGITDTLKDLLDSGVKPEVIAEELINKIIANPKLEYLPLLEKLPEVQAPFPEAKLLTAFTMNLQKVVAAPIAKPAAVPKPVAKPAEKPAEKPVEKPAETPVVSAKSQALESKDFDWEKLLDAVEQESKATATFLQQSAYNFDGKTLTITPQNKFAYNGLNKDAHKLTLEKAVSGIKIVIAKPVQNSAKEDPLVSKISDIMGGAEEVKNSGGKIPF